MRFTSYFLATLLSLAPVSVYANGCKHFETFYVGDCPEAGCIGTEINYFGDDFKNNEKAFKDWAAKYGGPCAGWCEKPEMNLAGTFKWSFSIRCHVPRLPKVVAALPKPSGRLRIPFNITKCDVNCIPAHSGQDCNFKFGDC